MKLTNPEKLILLMLSDIYDRLELDDVDTKLLRSAIHSENTWALDWEMSGVVGSDSEPTPPEVNVVVDYLDMWSCIEEAYSTFGDVDKKKIEAGAEPFGRHVRFPGFDGNRETKHLGIAQILINDMDRFSRFKGRDLNSHAPLLGAYARMYEAFEPMRNSLVGTRVLSVDQVIAVLNAMRYL